MFKRLILLVAGCLLLLYVFSYATMNVNIEPNKDGVISKSKKANVVIQLTSNNEIDMGGIVIYWNGEDITQEILDTAAARFNENKTEVVFYYPISVADLQPGIHSILVKAGDGEWNETKLIVQDYDHNSIYFSLSNPMSTPKGNVSSQLQKTASTANADTIKPTVTKFDVQPLSITEGNSVTITYTVQDTGGSGLKQVELWRKKDNGSWAEITSKRKYLSGNGPVSGSFSDNPSPSGTYYYGVHVVDNAGNWNSEGGAKSVVVLPLIPSITSFTGRTWGFTCPVNSTKYYYHGYYQVPYDKCSSSTNCPSIPFYVNGSNLDKLTSVEIAAANYKVAIKNKTSSTLTLDIRAIITNNWSDTSPAPISKPTLTFYYGNSNKITRQIDPGIVPVFYVDNQAWGQCTWYAGIIMRNRNGQSPVINYSSTIPILGDPNSSGFPKKGSVLNASDKHMAYLENITAGTPINNSDGSTSTTYTLAGSQYNWDCKLSKSSFTTTTADNMVVKKSKDGKSYTITQYPKVGYTVTKVKQ